MNTFSRYWRTLPTRHGLVLFGLLAAFFLVMRLLGLAQIFELRMLNFIFVFIMVYRAISLYQRSAGASYYEDFFDFFKIGFRTAMIGILLFAAFLALYLDVLDPEFMQELSTNNNYGFSRDIISPVIAAFAVIIEGMTSAVICIFIIIQWRKSRTVEKPVGKSESKLKDEARS
ncbi:MAG: DUF4199 domain-containing protein [Owenweeksia sp.]|nr:DUF4199 domain-containing protein [Owenweeksia sp.]